MSAREGSIGRSLTGHRVLEHPWPYHRELGDEGGPPMMG